jgi:hypothetical protein
MLFGATSANASATYMACDNPPSPDYAAMRVAPSTCHLGLGESVYEAQRVEGHPAPPTVVLRGLHWRHWGQFRATAKGRSCYENEEKEFVCSEVEIKDSRPSAIGPAGFAVIYQLMRVYYPEYHETDWYRPGVDY